MADKIIQFYKKLNGECPVEEFIDLLSSKAAQKVIWTLKLYEDLDRIPSIYFAKLVDTDNIWEFRVKWASDIFRVLGFFDGPKLILTNAFIKKKQKTPEQEIEKAELCRRDYFQRTRGEKI